MAAAILSDGFLPFSSSPFPSSALGSPPADCLALLRVVMSVVEGTGLGAGARVGGEMGLVVGGGEVAGWASVEPGTIEQEKGCEMECVTVIYLRTEAYRRPYVI